LRVAVYGDDGLVIGTGEAELMVPAHGDASDDVETLIGGFLDASWAYRFGSPRRAVVASFVLVGEDEREARTGFLFPAGPPISRESADALGLSARAVPTEDGVALELSADRLVYAVRVRTGLDVADGGFSLEPGRPRQVRLEATADGVHPASIAVEAINLRGRLAVEVEEVG
jgi:beta-mannosidase